MNNKIIHINRSSLYILFRMQLGTTRAVYLSLLVLLFRQFDDTELLAVNMYGEFTVGQTNFFMMKSIEDSDFAPTGCIMLFHSKLAARACPF